MDKQIYELLFLLIVSLQLINARVITTNDLEEALDQVEPGDTIELKSGVYRNCTYYLKSGSDGKPITIKPAPNAEVIFIGKPNTCIFNGVFRKYIKFYGPMVLQDSLCGFDILRSSNIEINGVSIYNMRQQAIIMSGDDINIIHNRIQGCVLENKEHARRKMLYSIECVGIHPLPNQDYSSKVYISENNISSSYGVALYFLKCEYCYAYRNEITNGHYANIYIHSSRDIQIYKNILRVNSSEYNNYYGKACGIAMTPNYSHQNIKNIFIQNNIFIGTRIGIFFFSDGMDTYNNVKILFNTLWNIDYTTILFKKHEGQDNAFSCEMKNNFIYFTDMYYKGAVEFEPKRAWEFASNYFYNYIEVPRIYCNSSDHTSKAIYDIPLDSLFNKIIGCENYYDPNLNPECLRPSLKPGLMKLYHSGIDIGSQHFDDFYSCNRSITTPSIGAFEYPVGCSEDEEPTDGPTKDYDVRFNITYCTTGYRAMIMIGSHCNWNAAKCTTMTKGENCLWTITFKNAANLNFKYKFAETIQTSIYKMESDPFRTFDGEYLWKLVNENSTGIYEDCKYSLSENLITLVCSWNRNL